MTLWFLNTHTHRERNVSWFFFFSSKIFFSLKIFLPPFLSTYFPLQNFFSFFFHLLLLFPLSQNFSSHTFLSLPLNLWLRFSLAPIFFFLYHSFIFYTTLSNNILILSYHLVVIFWSFYSYLIIILLTKLFFVFFLWFTFLFFYFCINLFFWKFIDMKP